MSVRHAVRGSTVGIVGGSIAGCAAAIALGRLGCDVHVFERSSSALRDRGSGIAIPLPLRDQLIGEGYLPPAYPSCALNQRSWVVADGTPRGREVWRQLGAGVTNNWGILWRSLRAGVVDERYHDGATVAAIVDDDAGVAFQFADGSSQHFDLLVGADGYRSTIRARCSPEIQPDYAGYILWRGNYPETRLTHRSVIEHGDRSGCWHTVCFDGGHGVIYMIPNVDDRVDPGHRRVNWAIYTSPPAGLHFPEPTSIPPGAVSDDLYSHLDRLLSASFPADFQAVIRESTVAEVSIQPIYDELAERYVTGRVMLIGDAGTVTRPHTGSGATKALQDALCLERLGRAHDDWPTLLAAYDTERTAAGVALVELGRRIGRDQVEHTPPWGSMSPADFDAWSKGTLSGQQLYLYSNAAPTTD